MNIVIIIIIITIIIIIKDLRHVFDKVDRNGDASVNRMELRLALDFLCKQYDINVKRVSVIIVILITIIVMAIIVIVITNNDFGVKRFNNLYTSTPSSLTIVILHLHSSPSRS